MNSSNEITPTRKPSTLARGARHIRRNVVAYLALFFALTGSAYAIERGSVGTKHLKKSAVRTGKIANSAVTRAKLAPAAVDAAQIAGGAVTRDKLAGGAVGTGNLAAGAVDTGRVANGSFTREKLAPGAVTRDQVGLVSARTDIDDVSTTGDGTVKDIFKHGPFTIRARCTMTNSGWTWFTAFVRSSEKATSARLGDFPYYRVEPNTFRTITSNVVTMNGGGTTVFPVNLWSESGRYLQVSVVATSRTYAAKDDCSYLITGFAG